MLVIDWRAIAIVAVVSTGCGNADGEDSAGTGEGTDGATSSASLGTVTMPSTTAPTGDPSSDPTTASSVTTTASSDSDADTTEGVADTTGNDTGTPADAAPSPGCGNSDVLPGAFAQIELMSGGRTRTFDLQVPPDHDGESPIPLVLAFHGWTLTSEIQAQMSDLSAVANARGFAVAYPQGIGNSWNAGSCCGDAFDQQVDDVEFALAIVESIGTEMCIDTNRVYSTGFSNGGFMSHRLGCVASDVFAAIGPVAGVIMIPDEQCTPPRAVPVMHLHGTADGSVTWEGNGMVPHISVPGSIAGWVDRNGCDPDPTVTFEQGDTTCETWSGCGDDGAEVVLCTIEGMGHCWPGDPQCTGLMETPSVTVQASEVVADFFEAHPMP
jgi:polyhydroxybutyrate depolymerase